MKGWTLSRPKREPHGRHSVKKEKTFARRKDRQRREEGPGEDEGAAENEMEG